MRAKDYIKQNEHKIKYLSEIQTIINDLYPHRDDKDYTLEYVLTRLCADVRYNSKYGVKVTKINLLQKLFQKRVKTIEKEEINNNPFEYEENELNREIAFQVRYELLEVVREDKSFGYLFQILLEISNPDNEDSQDWKTLNFRRLTIKAIKYDFDDVLEHIATMENVQDKIDYLKRRRKEYF